MPAPYRRAAAALEASRSEIARRVAEEHFRRHPELEERYGAIGRQRCLEDAEFHLQYLGHALAFDAPALFVQYVQWARDLLEKRRVPWEDLRTNLDLLRDALTKELAGEEGEAAGAYIDAALAAEPGPSASHLAGTPREPLASAYLTALLARDRRAATAIVEAAVAEGVPIRDFYLYVFQPVQREIGRLWQNNEISVAEEHYCTASTQAMMAQFYPRILSTPRVGRKIVVACVGNELHEIGTRMVADFFEMEGWDSVYLGANTPGAALVDLVCRERPQLVALGVTMTYHLGTAMEHVRRLRADERCHDVKVIVGGYVFQGRPDLWRQLGAEGFAEDAAAAVALGNELIDGTRP